jgi:DDE_Tnp_1-associated
VDSSAEESEALYETVVFLNYFKDLPDARQIGKVKYPLDEILLLCLVAVVAGAETITEIARFGRMKLAFLKRFRPFQDGTPAHDHSATFWPPWTPRRSSVALSPGSRR